MSVPYGTSYFDQSGNFHVNGGKLYDSSGNDVSSNLSTLGSLGDAASLDVGTTAGTVAAGDDSRITGALQGTAAIASEVNTGTSTTKFINPDALAGSLLGERVVQLEVFAPTTNCATGDGKKYFVVPAPLNGMNLIGVHGRAITAGTTGTMDVQIRNVTDSVDMLSTKLTWDTTEAGTNTADVPAVIDATKDDVATNDLIAIDVDAVQATPAQGMIITLRFQLP